MKEPVTNPLIAIEDMFNQAFFGPQPGDYIELVDEDDEQGPVRLCRADGTMVMCMPRSAYEAFKDNPEVKEYAFGRVK